MEAVLIQKLLKGAIKSGKTFSEEAVEFEVLEKLLEPDSKFGNSLPNHLFNINK